MATAATPSRERERETDSALAWLRIGYSTESKAVKCLEACIIRVFGVDWSGLKNTNAKQAIIATVCTYNAYATCMENVYCTCSILFFSSFLACVSTSFHPFTSRTKKKNKKRRTSKTLLAAGNAEVEDDSSRCRMRFYTLAHSLIVVAIVETTGGRGKCFRRLDLHYLWQYRRFVLDSVKKVEVASAYEC